MAINFFLIKIDTGLILYTNIYICGTNIKFLFQTTQESRSLFISVITSRIKYLSEFSSLPYHHPSLNFLHKLFIYPGQLAKVT